MLVDTIEKVKAISFDSSNLDVYVASLRGLSATQAEVALSSAGLDKVQKQQILNKLAETNATVSLTSAEATAALTKTLGSKADAEALLIKTGLVTQEQLLAGATIEVSAAQLAALVSEGALTQADYAKITSALGLTTSNIGLGASFKLLAKSIWASVKAMAAWLFTTPAGWATLAISAIVGVIAAYGKWGDTLENTREKLVDLKAEYNTITSNIESTNKELETTKQRIAELEGKGTLTFTEKEELDNLVKQNNELQRTVDLLKLEQDENKKEKNKTFVKTAEKDLGRVGEYHLVGRTDLDGKATGEYYDEIKDGYSTDSRNKNISEAEYIQRQFDNKQKLLDELAATETESERKRIQDKIDKIDEYLKEKNKQFIEDAEGIDYIQNPTTEDDKKVNEWLDYINDFQDKMAIAMGGDNAKENAFNRLVDNWKFDELLNPLQKLGKEGKVTAEMLTDPKYDAFIQKLIDIKFISDDTEGSLRFVASAFNGTMQSAQKYVTALKGDDLDNFVDNLGEEAKALGTTESELAKLTAAHVIFNDTELSTEQQQRVLQQLADKIAATGEEMKYLLKLFNIAAMDSVDELMAKGMTKHEAIRRIESVRKHLKDKYSIDLSPTTIPEKEDDNGGGGGTGGGDKDKTNEALDNYLKDAENRYKIHQDELKYIQELQYAYNNLTKEEKERLDIAGKINEAFRDLADNRIKDIEHQIDLAKELNEYADVTDYYKQIQKVSHEEATRLRAMGYDDNSNEIQDLQKTWWDAQNKIADESYSNSERWISERNTYNDWELYGDNEVAAWERVLKRFKTEFPNELEKIKDIEQKIFEARKDAMEKSIDDIEDYIDARNTYNDWDAYGDSEVKAIQRQTKIIEQSYRDRLLSYEEYVDRLEEQQQRLYSLAQDEVDKHLSNIDKYIDARNHYNDWSAFDDSEIEAIKRQLAILDEAYELNLLSLEEYTEKSAEYTQKLYSVAKENIIETVSELVEEYEEMRQFESSQLESQKTLLQSYYDVTNAISEAQSEIDKELRASMTMHEYLNEETRELLFNQEDYNALNKELLDIQTAANELQKQYQEDILNANAETIAEITSQYQMQYETMMKQYEIAKAELEVAKKRQKLDNVLAERNTRMFINGQWQWVAKTQDVINAQNELAEAEIERKKQEASLEQTEAINKFTEQINNIETDLKQIRKKWADMQEMLEGESDEVAKALKEISQVSSPELQRIIEATGGSIDTFSVTLSESTDTLSTIINSDLNDMSTGINDIITDLEDYSDAIQLLINKIKGLEVEEDEDDDDQIKDSSSSGGSSSKKVNTTDQYVQDDKGNIQSNPNWDGKIKGGVGSFYVEDSSSSGGGSSSSKDSSSSKGGSSTTTATRSDGSKVDVTIDASTNSTTTKGLSTGTVVHTDGGDYKIVSPNTSGASYNPNSGYWSIKVKEKDADGTRYTAGGLTLMGEEGEELYIQANGRLIPINQPTIGNIGAGGIVFNREQMANLRNLWDLSNLGKVSPFVSSSNANSKSTVIDNSIHINGLTVGEQGNEDWINGLRRYVATHK